MSRFNRCLLLVVIGGVAFWWDFAPPALGQTAKPVVSPNEVVWRTDYAAARKEAHEKGLPILLVVSSDNCFYCRKLEAGPLQDPRVTQWIAPHFIPLKINASHAPDIAKALKINLYPTTVLAGPDGKIHAFIEGYIESDRYAEQLKRTLTTLTTPDWAARDFHEASRALAQSDYARAVTLLQGITKDAGDKPVAVKARQLLAEVEKTATAKLAQAQQLDEKGRTQEAMDLLAETVRDFAGTQAAREAATLLATVANRPEIIARKRARLARDLLASARDDLRHNRVYDCLQKCEQLTAGYAELPEAKEAAALHTEIINNPDRLAQACEQMNDRTAAMYLTLAESWINKGQPAEAVACLKKVMVLCPNTKHAEVAAAELKKIHGRTPAITTGGSQR
ncbi:MAG: thioredoxin family protein [Gemmataceae bacterium]|nr:thioredoxin family protein [Gemmata sp.]MDW8199108.1 thioredoxin family protein [Gemmataceae bacterium]